MICQRYLISGKVQGVFYRAHTQTQARHLGLKGFAKNLDNSDVEVVACGNIELLRKFEKILWQGSPMSEVDNVISEMTNSYQCSDFVDFKTY